MPDFETDLTLGKEYSVESALENITDVEEHLDKILLDKKYRDLCVACMKKHARLIRDKGRDCSTRFTCPPDRDIWEKLYKWSWKLQESIPILAKNKETEQLRDEARAFRKVLDGEWEKDKLEEILQLDEEKLRKVVITDQTVKITKEE